MKLSENEYKKLDQVALQIRIDYDFLGNELDVIELSKLLNVTLVPYSQLGDEARNFILSRNDKINDGFFAFEYHKYNLLRIFYNDEKPIVRRRFTICHELEHFIFNDKDDGEYEEAKANHFARQLLIPTCLVIFYILKGDEPYDLAFKFNVSYEVALNAYAHAINRIQYIEYHLEDYEIVFMKLYYERNFNTQFDNYLSLLKNK